jgi:hypothetical protein
MIEQSLELYSKSFAHSATPTAFCKCRPLNVASQSAGIAPPLHSPSRQSTATHHLQFRNSATKPDSRLSWQWLSPWRKPGQKNRGMGTFICRQTVSFALVSTPIRWKALALVALLYMIIYLKNSNIAVAAPAIRRAFGLSKSPIDMAPHGGPPTGMGRGGSASSTSPRARQSFLRPGGK